MADDPPSDHGGDPSLVAVLHSRAVYIDRKIATLRLQMLFMFMFLIAALITMSWFFRGQDQQIKYERYTSCMSREAEIAAWNAALPLNVPHYTPPPCPPDPYAE